MAIRTISAALAGGFLLIASAGAACAENAIPHGKKAIPQAISDQAAAGNLSSFMHTNKDGTKTGIPRGRSNNSIPKN
ncbi:MAG: hypothetical protein U1E20_11035 [Methylocystis sp.]|uniref:hypothetical protein n=1 Tax=Methylocystis sp. TaxID=1911079 RepID=UPI00395ED728